MTFPNAYDGIKKVFTSQILLLISTGCYLLGAIIAAIGGVSGSVAGVAGGGVFIVGGAVLSVIALIFNLVGLSRASHDEQQFRPAFILSVISLILSIVLTIVSLFTGSIVSTIGSLITQILGILVIRYVFTGISSLAEKLGRNDLVEYGRKLFTFICVVYCVAILMNILQLIFSSSIAMVATARVMSLLANIASIVGYILYLVYLNNAKNMLMKQ